MTEQSKRRSKTIDELEREYDEPIVSLLTRMVNEHGQQGAGDKLGVNRATFSYWLLKLRIDVRKVALAPGETIQIVPVGKE